MTVASFIASQRTEHGVRPREVLPVAGSIGVRGSTSGRPAPDAEREQRRASSTRR